MITIKNTSTSLAAAVLVLAAGLPLSAVASHTYQTSNMLHLVTGGFVRGAGTMTRSADAVWANLSTKNLRRNNAYSLWWVIWNDPSQCLGGACGDESGDFGVPGNTVFYAGGFVTGDEKTAHISVHLDAGDVAEGVDVLIPGQLDPANGYDAEIHIVIRSHGGIIRGMADVQIGTFDGACAINTCFDHLGIIFAPNPPAAP